MYNHTYTCTGCNSTPCICQDEWLSQKDVEELQSFSQSLKDIPQSHIDLVNERIRAVDAGEIKTLTHDEFWSLVEKETGYKVKGNKMSTLKLMRISIADTFFRTVIRVLDWMKDLSFRMWTACVNDRFNAPERPEAITVSKYNDDIK
jgi:hypothetical protein